MGAFRPVALGRTVERKRHLVEDLAMARVRATAIQGDLGASVEA